MPSPAISSRLTRLRPAIVVRALAALALVCAVVFVAVALQKPAPERIVLVDDGPNALRLDNCPFNGIKVLPGRDPDPVDVSTRIGCSVFRDRDAAYLGCLVLSYQHQQLRRVPVLASVQQNIDITRCSAIDDP
jgi:hypothetical protein